MTLQDLYKAVSQLGFEDSLGDDSSDRFIYATNRALIEINSLRPIQKHVDINHRVPKNLLFSKPTQIEKTEALMNQWISEKLPVQTDVMNIEEAKKTGAMALFGEKYADDVRVVSMGDFSKELCGGTHVANTSIIGSFKLVSEAGVAAGVRRIEAVTGRGVLNYIEEKDNLVVKTAAVLKTNLINEIDKKAESISLELKAMQILSQLYFSLLGCEIIS